MIIIGVFGISLSSIFVRYSTAPSGITAAWRLIWTVVLLTPFVLSGKSSRKELFSVSPRLLIVSVVSGIFLAAHFLLWFESLKHTSVASSTVIVCTEVIWVAIGYVFFMKGKMNWRPLIAIGTCLVGSVLIAVSDSDLGNSLYGDLLAVLAAIAVAVYTLLGRYARKYLTTTSYTYIVYISCCTTLLVVCLLRKANLFSFGYSPIVVGGLLSVFSTILGHSIFSWCLKYFSPSFVSASKLCEPVVASIFAGFLFFEVPGWMQVFGGLTVLAGVLYYSFVETKIKSNGA